MAETAGVVAAATVAAALVVALSSMRSEISGEAGLLWKPAALPALHVRSVVRVEASKKLNIKDPFGPSGRAKFRGGVDASGRKTCGKGVYQFSKKYGANVDGNSYPNWRNKGMPFFLKKTTVKK